MPKRDKPKSICKWWDKKSVDDHIDLLAEITAEPRYVCRKCGRVAEAKGWLCKATPLPVHVTSD